MTTFQPFAPGLGQAFPIGTATDEPAVTHAEDPDMPKQHPIAKRLLAAIANAGGSLAAAQLAE